MTNGVNTAFANGRRQHVDNLLTHGFRNGTAVAVNIIDRFGRVLTLPPLGNAELRDDTIVLRSSIIHTHKVNFTKIHSAENVIEGPFRGRHLRDEDVTVEVRYDIEKLWEDDIYCEELDMVLTVRGLEDLPPHPAFNASVLTNVAGSSATPLLCYKIFMVGALCSERTGLYINMFGNVDEVPNVNLPLPTGLYIVHNSESVWRYERHDIGSDGPYPLYLSPEAAKDAVFKTESYTDVVKHLKKVVVELEEAKEIYRNECERFVRAVQTSNTQYSDVSKGMNNSRETGVKLDDLEIKNNYDMQSSARKNSVEVMKHAPGLVGAISTVARQILQG